MGDEELPEKHICPFNNVPADECPTFDGEKERAHLDWHLAELHNAGVLELAKDGRYRLSALGKQLTEGKKKQK